MFIFIDESGSFSNSLHKKNAVSCVGGLIITEDIINPFFDEFKKLKTSWGISKNEEIKGSQINETQANELIQLSKRFDVILKIVATDIGIHDPSTITEHKLEQANKIKHSTAGYSDGLSRDLINLATNIENLPNQLYVQSTLMTLLVDNLIRESSLYYCQWYPLALENFNWIIDAKNKKITEYETTWSSICMPFLQSISLQKPLIKIREGDYSQFDKFYVHHDSPPEHLKDHMPKHKADKPFSALDVKKLLKDMRFSNSKMELGLQIADLLITTVRRSFSLTMQIEGWNSIGQLMLQVPKSELPIHFIRLGEGDEVVTTPYGKIVTMISAKARSPFINPKIRRT